MQLSIGVMFLAWHYSDAALEIRRHWHQSAPSTRRPNMY